MYDTVIIGNDISSLVAACAIAHKGKKAILLREGDIPEYIALSGYTFNIDPFPWTGFAPDGISRKLLAKCGAPPVERFATSFHSPAIQMIFPEHRIDLMSDVELLLQALADEFADRLKDLKILYESIIKGSRVVARHIDENPHIRPQSASDYVKFLLTMPTLALHGYGLSRKLRKFEKNLFLKRTIDAQALLFSHLDINNGRYGLSLAYALASLTKKVHYHVGGKHFFIDEIQECLERKGGTLVKGCSILRLNIHEDIRTDIMVGKEVFPIEANNLIVSAKWEKIRSMLFSDERFSKVARKYASVKPTLHPFTIHMGLNARGIPEKMAGYVLLIRDETKPLVDDNLVFLETSAAEDTARAPLGKRAMSATVLLHESPQRLSEERLRQTAEEVLHHIEAFLPFLRENLEFIDIGQSIKISRSCQEVLNRKYTVTGTPTLGISPLDGKTPCKNVHVTGGILLAGLGFEGEVLSGINSADMVMGER